MKMLSVINNDEIRNELKKFGEKNQISDDELFAQLFMNLQVNFLTQWIIWIKILFQVYF